MAMPSVPRHLRRVARVPRARARDAPRAPETRPLSGHRREAPRCDAAAAGAAARGWRIWRGVRGAGPLVRSQWRLAVHASRGLSRSGAWHAVACGRSRLSVLPERWRRLFARRPDRSACVAACRRAVGRSGRVAGVGSGVRSLGASFQHLRGGVALTRLPDSFMFVHTFLFCRAARRKAMRRPHVLLSTNTAPPARFTQPTVRAYPFCLIAGDSRPRR
jgi:hypothetical protein